MRLLVSFFITATMAGAQQFAPTAPAPTSPWFNAHTVDFIALTPSPPAAGSQADRQDMDNVLHLQQSRTPAQVQQAQADDKEEDMFVFASVLGPKFSAAELPLTKTLSDHLRNASAVINPSLKLHFGRPRPFVASSQVHPVCEKTASESFPSGHAMVGTLEALALTQIVPERSPGILQRLDEYTGNRVVCGVHYPSDVAASRIVGSSLFGLIAASPVFQEEIAEAKAELRGHLGLHEDPSPSAPAQNHLANNTVLIVRHAEKPPEEARQAGLTQAGQRRAEAYISYFEPFHEGGMRLSVNVLFAGADSASSVRPRLTLEPLSRAAGIALDTAVSTKDPASLVKRLKVQPHGDTPLICWRHGQIPALLTAFGVAPASLLPGGTWPDEVYDWVLVLRFDSSGHVQSQRLIHENLYLP